MVNRIKSKLEADSFFFLSYDIFIAASLLSTSFFYRFFMGVPLMWVQIVCAMLLLVHELRYADCQGLEKRGAASQHWLGFILLMWLAISAALNSIGNQHRLVVFIFLYAYCARNVSFEKLIRRTLQISIAVVCLVVFSGYIGIIDNVVIAKGNRVREYLGFRYALYLPGILLNMTALWIYLRRKNVPIVEAVLWALVNWIVYVKTDSRISFAIAELLIVLALIMRFWPKIQEKIQPLWALAASSFVIFGGISMLMTCIYDARIGWMRKLNSMLESRLSLGKRSLVEFGVPWFGQKIEWLGNGLDAFGNTSPGRYTYVDSMYIKILQRYGPIFFVLLMVLATWAMFRLWKKRHYHILLIMASVAAHCVLDDLSFALHYNTFWIALAVVLMNPSKLDQEEQPVLPPTETNTEK